MDRQVVPQLFLVLAWLPSALLWHPWGLHTWQLSHSAQRSLLLGPLVLQGGGGISYAGVRGTRACPQTASVKTGTGPCQPLEISF